MYILVCNVGSTSLKFKLYDMPSAGVLSEGKVERVGSRDDAIFHYRNCLTGFGVSLDGQCVPTYTDGIKKYLERLTGPDGALDGLSLLGRVGFKTVLAKGYHGVYPLDRPVLDAMEEYLPIAPVHNSCYLEAIRQFQDILPGTPLIGVFETAFHATIPLERRLYGVPYSWYEEHGVQRFGYHGASHGYVADEIASVYGPDQRVISCHLGGSCSICAIADGKSVDNSFGFSLQTGLIHANRTGDLDPYVIPFMLGRGLSMDEILAGLDKNGGLKGISGVSNDLRHVRSAAEDGDERSKLAVGMFMDGIVRYIGSSFAFLGGLDHLVFTGGIGENDWRLRADVCQRTAHLGVSIDEAANSSGDRKIISTPGSRVVAHVIPADEEIVVARRTYEYKKNHGGAY
ncbi:MAG: acetate/propionate family kinase [Synergistaceae bacterium]|jgi:acetate kinase|nr:acetate/propionate family kinase [Synergistaceae bacterium]